jgi:hypothetical protein
MDVSKGRPGTVDLECSSGNMQHPRAREGPMLIDQGALTCCLIEEIMSAVLSSIPVKLGLIELSSSALF